MKTKRTRTQGFRQQNGKLETANGVVLEIPTVFVENALDCGANGEIFVGIDSLGRKVAIKVWKTYTTPRGFERAREELRKLAALKDHGRLFAHVYSFGALPVPKHPDQRIAYAVLEYVEGVSGKAWLKSGPDFNARYAIWKLLKTALSTIYGEGALHGDPHLGNILIISDARGLYREYLPAGFGINTNPTRWELSPFVTLPSLGVKLIDFGSSLLWDDHTNFVARECTIIGETFAQLFPDIGTVGPDKRAIGANPLLTLLAFDVWLEYSNKVEQALKDPRLASLDSGRSYDSLLPLERTLSTLLFGHPLLSVSILRIHMQQLGFDYDKLLGENYEAVQRDYLAVGNGTSRMERQVS